MAYTYHIALTGTAYTEFTPSEEPVITFQEVAGEAFLQPVIEEIKLGALLNATAYTQLLADYFDTSEFGNQIRIKIQRNGVDAFFFRSSVSNTKIDTEKKTFIIAPEPDDEYQNILDVYDKKLKDKTILGSVVNVYYWVNPTNKFVNVDLDTFADTANVVSWTFSGLANKKARLTWTGLAPTIGDQVRVLLSDVTGVGSIRLVNSAFAATSNTVLTDANEMKTLTTTATGSAYIEFFVLPGGDASGTFTYAAYSHKDDLHGKKLSSYIDLMLSTLGVSQTCVSTHLFGDSLPSVSPTSINTFLTASAGYDYVTLQPQIFNDTICLTSLDFDGTTDLRLSFSELMNIIRVKLRCLWYIDSDGYMRIEHQKYFRSWGPQIDITSATYSKYKPEIDQLEYLYNKSDIFNQIELSEAYSTGDDFLNTEIIYDIIKTSPKTTSTSPPNVITDMTDVLSTTDDRQLYFLANCQLIGAKLVTVLAAGVIDPDVYVQNIQMSWAYLLTKYWTYFAEADSATINGTGTLTAEHVKEFLSQSGIKFYHDGILNWRQPITLTLGTGWLKKMNLDLSSGFYMIDVGYDPYNI